MKQIWQKWAVRIDALTLRERLIIFAVAALALVTVMNTLLLDPLMRERDTVSKRIKDEQAQIARVRADIQRLLTESTLDPDASRRKRLEALQSQIAELRQAVAGMQRSLISPDKMPSLLEGMLRGSSGLQLTSLKKLSVTSLVENGGQPQQAASSGQEITGLYRHGVELTVQGGYLDMLSYLAELEQLSPQLFWDDAVFTVDQYPNATMTLRVYTLSLDRQWLHL